MFDQSKPWYLSRTVWASIITVGAALGGLGGLSIGADTQTMLTEGILQAITALSGIVAVLGRLSATTRIA